jgi:hypothetical protein
MQPGSAEISPLVETVPVSVSLVSDQAGSSDISSSCATCGPRTQAGGHEVMIKGRRQSVLPPASLHDVASPKVQPCKQTPGEASALSFRATVSAIDSWFGTHTSSRHSWPSILLSTSLRTTTHLTATTNESNKSIKRPPAHMGCH